MERKERLARDFENYLLYALGSLCAGTFICLGLIKLLPDFMFFNYLIFLIFFVVFFVMMKISDNCKKELQEIVDNE
ncbi:hypothetical protein [Lactococcus petauri]|uniref:hypothetical protein n=1 Tax=Lactococcus petauri TaxID=1940789 RepID=UPI00385424BD